ncbi:hypothetical protein [Desulfurobacterium crinifex]
MNPRQFEERFRRKQEEIERHQKAVRKLSFLAIVMGFFMWSLLISSVVFAIKTFCGGH